MAIDDLLDCPLRELNLIGRAPDTGRYRFALGAKPTLPSEILSYAVLDYVDRANIGGNIVTLDRLTTEPGAPGRAFKLTESEMLAGLEPTVHRVTGLDLVSVTGAIQLSWSAGHQIVARKILDQYYGVPAPGSGAARTAPQLALSRVGGT